MAISDFLGYNKKRNIWRKFIIALWEEILQEKNFASFGQSHESILFSAPESVDLRELIPAKFSKFVIRKE